MRDAEFVVDGVTAWSPVEYGLLAARLHTLACALHIGACVFTIGGYRLQMARGNLYYCFMLQSIIRKKLAIRPLVVTWCAIVATHLYHDFAHKLSGRARAPQVPISHMKRS